MKGVGVTNTLLRVSIWVQVWLLPFFCGSSMCLTYLTWNGLGQVTPKNPSDSNSMTLCYSSSNPCNYIVLSPWISNINIIYYDKNWYVKIVYLFDKQLVPGNFNQRFLPWKHQDISLYFLLKVVVSLFKKKILFFYRSLTTLLLGLFLGTILILLFHCSEWDFFSITFCNWSVVYRNAFPFFMLSLYPVI